MFPLLLYNTLYKSYDDIYSLQRYLWKKCYSRRTHDKCVQGISYILIIIYLSYFKYTRHRGNYLIPYSRVLALSLPLSPYRISHAYNISCIDTYSLIE